MPKTITLRIDDDTYEMIKVAANGVRRTISNFLEVAAVSFISEESFVSDDEMSEIIADKPLTRSLSRGLQDIKNRRYSLVK